mmetsp:Transcript_95199/g.252851  ORF Transcript_95199/g.252851 Transcript_95199/m.252851 type:complete len:94 (+) Transcript_95199:108-389(+)
MPRLAVALLLLLQSGMALGASLRGAGAGQSQAATKLAEEREALEPAGASLDDVDEESWTSLMQTPARSANAEGMDCMPKPGGLESLLLEPDAL